MAYRHYDEAFKTQAIAAYIAVGSFRRAAARVGIEVETLRGWFNAPEHRPVVQRLRSEFATGMATEAVGVAAIALEKLRLKLEEGGTSARDLAVVHGILCDKAQAWSQLGGNDTLKPSDLTPEAHVELLRRYQEALAEQIRRSEAAGESANQAAAVH